MPGVQVVQPLADTAVGSRFKGRLSGAPAVQIVQAVQMVRQAYHDRPALPLIPSINSGRALSVVEGFAPFKTFAEQRTKEVLPCFALPETSK